MRVISVKGYKLVALLSLAGFFSGLITICADYPVGPDLQLFLGIPLGVLISACLGRLRGKLNAWTAVKFIIATGNAYPLSGLLAGAIFLGGAVGGFLVLGSGMYLFESGMRWRAFKVAVFCSPLGGVLGLLGWALSTSLGMALWSFAHALHLTAPTETFQNAAGQTSHSFALIVVWETGMAFALGVLLWRYEAKPRGRELEQP